MDKSDSEHELHLTETAILGTATVTETRMGYTRDLNSQAAGDSSQPSILVAGAFNAGSAQTGNTRNVQDNYNVTNVTTRTHGANTVRFGAHFYRVAVNDIAPANFGGTFSFFGVSNAPELDGNNQAIPGTGISISSPEQYRRTLLFTQMGYSPGRCGRWVEAPRSSRSQAGTRMRM